jgi:hypothetical protein
MGPIKRAVNDYLASTGNLKRSASVACIEIWPQVVGPWYAGKTHLLGVENAEARVLCDAPATAQQLQMDSERIIALLNERLGARLVSSIRASSAGPITDRLTAELRRQPEPLIEPEDIEAAELSAEDEQTCTRAASEIEDEQVRAAFTRAMRTYLKRQTVKRQRGFRPCELCGSLYNELGPHCSACATAVNGAR